ncbi:MAG: FHA domain-containing protein [Deltaproteobacteria bacterium]|nr:FHA domain-containing protein [Deltaproteobacteria bacterium]
MMLEIVVKNRKTNEKKDYRFAQPSVLIGRQANCDIILPANGVSRRHAKITINKSLVELEDLGSGNGTFLKQDRIQPHIKEPLKNQDLIKIEEFDIEILIKPEKTDTVNDLKNTVEQVDDPDMIEIKMIKKVLGALDQDKAPSITVVAREHAGKKAIFENHMTELVIGRDPNCHLFLNDAVVSRRHAVITTKWGGYVISDLKSRNGTFVNGEKITEKAVKDGDEITIGTIKAVFKNPSEFDFAAITKSLEDEKRKSEPAPSANKTDSKETADEASAAAKASVDSSQEFSKDDIKSEENKNEETQETKKPSEKAAKEESNPKNKNKANQNTAEENNEEVEEILKDTEAKDSKTKLPKALNLNFNLKMFTPTEWALFGFGALIILFVISMLVVVLS